MLRFKNPFMFTLIFWGRGVCYHLNKLPLSFHLAVIRHIDKHMVQLKHWGPNSSLLLTLGLIKLTAVMDLV